MSAGIRREGKQHSLHVFNLRSHIHVAVVYMVVQFIYRSFVTCLGDLTWHFQVYGLI